MNEELGYVRVRMLTCNKLWFGIIWFQCAHSCSPGQQTPLLRSQTSLQIHKQRSHNKSQPGSSGKGYF